jgi:hypothetical protein
VSGDDAVALEMTQPFRQQVAADTWKTVEQVREAPRP